MLAGIDRAWQQIKGLQLPIEWQYQILSQSFIPLT